MPGFSELKKTSSGDILINGKKVIVTSPNRALDLGIGLIPEDRKKKGLFLDFSISWNTEMSVLKHISHGLVIVQAKANQIVEEYTQKMRVKAPSLDVTVGTLSGGNQQKVVLSKTLACKSKIVIFDEPTRGIDVAAKKEIYELMCDLAKQGVSILMITSDMEELLGMSDRIVIMHEGMLSGELQRKDFNQNKVLEYASGMQE